MNHYELNEVHLKKNFYNPAFMPTWQIQKTMKKVPFQRLTWFLDKINFPKLRSRIMNELASLTTCDGEAAERLSDLHAPLVRGSRGDVADWEADDAEYEEGDPGEAEEGDPRPEESPEEKIQHNVPHTDMSKRQRIGCVLPHYKLQCGITQPVPQCFGHICRIQISQCCQKKLRFQNIHLKLFPT